MIQKPELFGFQNETLPTRITFVLVGIWWVGFAQITFRRMPKDSPVRSAHLVRQGFNELVAVWRKIRAQRVILIFLISFLFYMAGVQTVIYLSTIFASAELDMTTAELIIVMLLLQIVAIGGALLFARVSKWVGNRNSLLIQIGIWIGIDPSAPLGTWWRGWEGGGLNVAR